MLSTLKEALTEVQNCIKFLPQLAKKLDYSNYEISSELQVPDAKEIEAITLALLQEPFLNFFHLTLSPMTVEQLALLPGSDPLRLINYVCSKVYPFANSVKRNY